MNRRPRILIADNCSLVADGCKLILDQEFDVVDVVTNGRSLVALTTRIKPEGVILEIRLPQLSGFDAANQIKRNSPLTKLLFLTARPDPNLAAEAFRCGASGYVLKQHGAEEFRLAVRAVMRGGSYLSSLIARETLEYLLRQPKQQSIEKEVTRRQSEILQLLAEGNSMKEVANMLTIRPGTVAFHKYKMMERLGIKTNAELLQFAMRSHISPQIEEWAVSA